MTVNEVQMDSIEGSMRLALQRLANLRTADRKIGQIADHPNLYESTYIREAERAERFANDAFNTALDELYDELTAIVVPMRIAGRRANPNTAPQGIPT